MQGFNRKILLFIYIVVPAISFAQQQSGSFNVATYNIKYDNPKDTANVWKARKAVIANLLRFNEVDILGIQEGLYHQVQDLDSLLPNHSYVGVGRDDGAKKGEFSAIFYNSALFEVLETNTFWLSETPEKPSKGWDAALPRICTWTVLKDKKSNDIVFVFNTHYDHIGQVARINSTALILRKIKEIAENNPILLMGDFNSEPDSQVYQQLQRNLDDALIITETPHFGPIASFNAFEYFSIPKKRLDYIFVDHFNVLSHAILNNHYGLKYPSDHFPVVAELQFQ